MDDKTFINYFLDSNFEVKLVDGEPAIIDKYENRKPLREIDFNVRVIKIIGTYLTDDGMVSRLLVSKWLQNAYAKLNLGYRSYLLDCKVVLKNKGWVAVNSVGEEITPQHLVRAFDYKGDIKDVEKHFDKWWSVSVNLATEEMMKQF